MNDRKLLQAIVAAWLVNPHNPVNADQAAYDVLDWESYGHEQKTRSLVEAGYLKWDASTSMVENEDRWIMVVPTAQGIFEAMS